MPANLDPKRGKYKQMLSNFAFTYNEDAPFTSINLPELVISKSPATFS